MIKKFKQHSIKESEQSTIDYELVDSLSNLIRVTSLEVKIEGELFVFEVTTHADGEYFVTLLEGDSEYLKSRGESFSGSTYEDQVNMNNSDFTDSLFEETLGMEDNI